MCPDAVRNSGGSLVFPVIPLGQYPAGFADAMVGRAMELVHKAREIAPEFPYRADHAASDLAEFSVRCRDMYSPALSPRIEQVRTGLSSIEFQCGGSATMGTFNPWSLGIGVPNALYSQDNYKLAMSTVVHELTHVDQFFPSEIRAFVPSIDTVHARVQATIDMARASGVFMVFDKMNEAAKQAGKEAYRKFVEHAATVWPELAERLAKREDFPPGNLEHALIGEAYGLPDSEKRSYSVSVDLVQYLETSGLKCVSIPFPEGAVPQAQKRITDISRDHIPELHSSLELSPPKAFIFNSDSLVGFYLLLRSMVALLDTPSNRSRAAPIYVRTLHAWRTLLNSYEDVSSRLGFEAEAHIVDRLFSLPAGRKILEVYVPEDPYENVSLPPSLQDVSVIGALFLGTSLESKRFLKAYRKNAALACSLMK